VRPALVVAISLAVFQQIIGLNAIIYYAPTTRTNVGYGNAAAIYASVINLLMTLVAIRLIDCIGRKPLLLGGLVGIVASLTVLGLSTLLLSEPSSPNDPVAIITMVSCLAVFIASFAAAWSSMVWVMLPEVLPLRIRGTAMGVAIFALDCQLYRRPDVSQLARLRRA
jgi:MFS family permease